MQMTPLDESWSMESEHVDSLLMRIGQKDRNAFREFYQLAAARLYGICRYVLGPSLNADEAFVATFRRIWQEAAGRGPGCADGVSWVRDIARQEAVAVLRRLRASGADLAGATLWGPSGAEHGGPDFGVGGAVFVRLLRDLPEKAEEAIRGAYILGQDAEDIARIEGVTVSEVDILMAEALVSLGTGLGLAGDGMTHGQILQAGTNVLARPGGAAAASEEADPVLRHLEARWSEALVTLLDDAMPQQPSEEFRGLIIRQTRRTRPRGLLLRSHALELVIGSVLVFGISWMAYRSEVGAADPEFLIGEAGRSPSFHAVLVTGADRLDLDLKAGTVPQGKEYIIWAQLPNHASFNALATWQEGVVTQKVQLAPEVAKELPGAVAFVTVADAGQKPDARPEGLILAFGTVPAEVEEGKTRWKMLLSRKDEPQ